MSSNDDTTIGKILSRRDAISVLGAGGLAAFLAACSGGKSSSFAPAASATARPAGADVAQPTASATQTSAPAAAANMPACVVRPALTEGPYFVDEKLNRSDIRSDP